MLNPAIKKLIVKKAIEVMKSQGYQNVNEESIFLDDGLSKVFEQLLRDNLTGEDTDIQLKRIIKIIEKIRKIRRGDN